MLAGEVNAGNQLAGDARPLVVGARLDHLRQVVGKQAPLDSDPRPLFDCCDGHMSKKARVEEKSYEMRCGGTVNRGRGGGRRAKHVLCSCGLRARRIEGRSGMGTRSCFR